MLSHDEQSRLLALGADLGKVWHAPTTAARDKKELLRTLLAHSDDDDHPFRRMATTGGAEYEGAVRCIC
jgi:hypothetical protein